MEKVSIYTNPPIVAMKRANDDLLARFDGGFEAARIEFTTEGTLLTIGIKWRKSPNPSLRSIVGTTDKESWDGKAPLSHPILYISGTRWFFGIN